MTKAFCVGIRLQYPRLWLGYCSNLFSILTNEETSAQCKYASAFLSNSLHVLIPLQQLRSLMSLQAGRLPLIPCHSSQIILLFCNYFGLILSTLPKDKCVKVCMLRYFSQEPVVLVTSSSSNQVYIGVTDSVSKINCR